MRTLTVVMTVILSLVLISYHMSTLSQTWKSPQASDEDNLVKILKNTGRSHNSQAETNNALVSLRALAESHLLKSSETFKILASYLDFRTDSEESNRHISIPSELVTYPAMAALYYAGDNSLPFLVNVLIEEKEGSTIYSNALWTLIDINNGDMRLTYAFLTDAAKHSRSRQQREKLTKAAHKVAAYDPIE